MTQIMGTLVPTTDQMYAALDFLREQLSAGGRTCSLGDDYGRLAWWDVPSGASVAVRPFHEDLLGWHVEVDVYGRPDSVLERCNVVPTLACNLGTAEGRDKLLAHVRWAEEVYRDIERIPETPEGPFWFFHRLHDCAEQVFAWHEREGAGVILAIGSPLPFLLNDLVKATPAPERPALNFLPDDDADGKDAAVPAAALEYVRAMVGGSHRAVNIACHLDEFVRRTDLELPRTLKYVHARLHSWHREGVSRREDCMPPEEIMAGLVNALIAESQRPTGG